MARFWWTAAAAWWVFMTVLSHQRGETTRRVSRALARDLAALLPGPDRETLHTALRKAAHPALFGVLTLLTGLALRSGGAAAPAPAQLAALGLWCWLDEVTKLPVEGRHFSWRDVGRNLLGTALAAVLLALLPR